MISHRTSVSRTQTSGIRWRVLKTLTDLAVKNNNYIISSLTFTGELSLECTCLLVQLQLVFKQSFLSYFPYSDIMTPRWHLTVDQQDLATEGLQTGCSHKEVTSDPTVSQSDTVCSVDTCVLSVQACHTFTLWSSNKLILLEKHHSSGRGDPAWTRQVQFHLHGQKNASAHWGRIIRERLLETEIPQMKWPELSPEFHREPLGPAESLRRDS